MKSLKRFGKHTKKVHRGINSILKSKDLNFSHVSLGSQYQYDS